MPVVCAVLVDYNTTLVWDFYGLAQRDAEKLNSYLIRADYGELNKDEKVQEKWSTPHFKAPRGISRYDFANRLEQIFLTALTDELGLTFNSSRTALEPRREEASNAPAGRGLPHQVSHFYFSKRPPPPTFTTPGLQPPPPLSFAPAALSGGASSSTSSFSSSSSSGPVLTGVGRTVKQEL